MLIDSDLLITWGGKSRQFKKHEFIFLEDEAPKWFYQVQHGKVRLFNTSPEGKEFTQGIFFKGDSFGEPPLLIQQPFPATSEAMEDSIIEMLPKETFFQILKEYPEIQDQLLCLMAKRIYNKSINSRSIVNCKPETRIIQFLSTQKKLNQSHNEKLLIPFTRQEIANFTGLRVETVIRTLTKMAEKKEVDIINHKLYY
jgi:CRP/FNR family transcriptional regulator